MKYSIIITALAILGFSSCKKDLMNETLPTPNNQNTLVNNFKQIKADDQFTWEANKEIKLVVTGLSEMPGISNTLQVSNEQGDVVYLKMNMKMNENIETKFNLPAEIKNIKVSYGSITKKYTTLDGVIKFDFIQEVAE